MSPEIRILYQLCHSEIFESTIATESDLKAWVANGRYLVKDKLSLKSSTARNLVSCKFNLLVRDTDFLYASLANDCNRFAQSSIESVSVIKQDATLPKNISWPLIQMYYASFFAIHAILRLFGKACSQFESDHMEAVLDIAMATNQHICATNIENGFYFTSFLKNKQELSFSKLKDSHADTWASFSDLLANLIQIIPDSTNGLSTHKNKTMDLLIKLKDLISKSGSQRGN